MMQVTINNCQTREYLMYFRFTMYYLVFFHLVSARVHTHPSSAVIFTISGYSLMCSIIGQRVTVTWEREGTPISEPRWESLQNRMFYLDGGVSVREPIIF